MKVGQSIHWSEIQRVRTPARRPYSFTLPPRDAFETISRAAGEGWKVRATFSHSFPASEWTFYDLFTCEQGSLWERAERCHHCRNELFSNSNFLIIGISVL